MSSLTTQKHTPKTRRSTGRALMLLTGAALVAVLAGCTGTGAAEVPADFPSAVQVPAGTVNAAAKADGAWTVSVTLDKDDSRQAALEMLTGAGFAVIGDQGANTNDRVYSLADEDYSVRVGVTTVGGQDVLNYTVAERQSDAK